MGREVFGQIDQEELFGDVRLTNRRHRRLASFVLRRGCVCKELVVVENLVKGFGVLEIVGSTSAFVFDNNVQNEISGVLELATDRSELSKIRNALRSRSEKDGLPLGQNQHPIEKLVN